MYKRTWVWLTAGALLLAGSGSLPRLIADAPAGTASETNLTDEQIKVLVGKLGADDFKSRDDAHKQLVTAGTAAIPALEQASHSGDPEVAGQARSALREIHRAMAKAASELVAKNQLWCFDMEKGPASLNTGGWPLISGDMAYVLGNDTKVHALDLKTGKEKWVMDQAANAGLPNAPVAPVITWVSNASVGENYLALAQARKVTVIGLAKHEQLWQKEFQPAAAKPLGAPAGPGGGAAGAQGGGPGVAQPGAIVAGRLPMGFVRPEVHVAGDLVVVRTDVLTAFHGDNGQEAWQMDFKAPGKMTCTSVSADGIVFLPTGDAVAAVDVAHKKQLWQKDVPGCMKLMTAGGTLVCMSENNLVAFDATSGEKRWEIDLPTPKPEAAAPAGGANVAPGGMNRPVPMNMVALMRRATIDATRVYVISGETLLSCDLKTGAKSEANLDLGADAGGGAVAMTSSAARILFTHLAAGQGKLYGVNNKGIYAFDGTTGAPLWSLPLNGLVLADPVAADGVLYYPILAQRTFGIQNGGFGPVQAPAPANGDVLPSDKPGLHALKLPS